MFMSYNTPKSRTKPADVRQEELMDAALALFIAKGVAGTSIDEIVAAAGVSKGGFYHHFAAKEALLMALKERYINNFMTILSQSQAGIAEDDWRGRMNAWLRVGVDYFFDELAVHDVVFHAFAPVDHHHGMMNNPVIDQIEGFLRGGAAAGVWQVEHPRLLAVMLFNALHGASDEAVLQGEHIGRETLIGILQQFFWRAVAPFEI